jgi:squalene-hopene/tetraprenyl-beta-curcumene cyclase
MNGDVWDTSVALFTILSSGRDDARDPATWRALEFVLEQQGPDGGFGWGSGSVHDCDVDSTAAVLRTLSVAIASAPPAPASHIQARMEGCRRYLLARQGRQGGFNVWAPTVVGAVTGPAGFLRGSLFDVASADVTARALAALVASGSDREDPAIRRALSFVLRIQAPNGGWWCRWWAGYVPGTAFVLDALGTVGLRWNRPDRVGDRLGVELHRSMRRGVRFLLDHQNPDGGWGETVRADVDEAWAGRGASRPGQTAAALFGLLRCGYPVKSGEIQRGYRWLLSSATGEGRWEDHQATFTILPGSSYYAHPLYNLTMLPSALTAFRKAADG